VTSSLNWTTTTAPVHLTYIDHTRRAMTSLEREIPHQISDHTRRAMTSFESVESLQIPDHTRRDTTGLQPQSSSVERRDPPSGSDLPETKRQKRKKSEGTLTSSNERMIKSTYVLDLSFYANFQFYLGKSFLNWSRKLAVLLNRIFR